MKETVRSVIEALGYDNGKFSVIAHGKEVRSMGFNTGYTDFTFLANVDSTPVDQMPSPALHTDLEEAIKIFNSAKINAAPKKVKYIHAHLDLLFSSSYPSLLPPPSSTRSSLMENCNKDLCRIEI